MSQSNLDMSANEIELTKELLLHDAKYLQDKSVKKVSLATLKRRSKNINNSSQSELEHRLGKSEEKPSKHMSIQELREQFKQ